MASKPSTLPSSGEAELDGPTSCVTFADGGAHWYRSSAVLLRFHKWFNKPSSEDTGKPPVLLGSCIKCDAGLRLIELRVEPEGQVFCHWEFLQSDPPRMFLLQKSRLKNAPNFDAATQVITVLAEDSFGNILKKKLKIADIED
ncbi:uncharacterized protein LOC115227694 isoform X1 [Octopus sinensis]|uniref:Uncharacterized protein LOC115227694 isoform X1 n=1 Tax=Octopus sinensis TaxID=2607531 RepID=A0A6P7TWJ9_9MOLL|nr:uncharacterized protein LOC115227694 isoform X2 [Octopus sinensis]XP_036354596.1 uncharacterized protein LOC115227694 isoform X1 [Octopus sinensis]